MTITLCGSTRFKNEFEEMNVLLTMRGHVVLSVASFPHADNVEWTEDEKTHLDLIHLAKIEMSDAIFVIDVNEYIGFSTKREIAWAKLRGKRIYRFSACVTDGELNYKIDNFGL